MRKCKECNLSSVPYSKNNNLNFECEYCGSKEYIKPFWQINLENNKENIKTLIRYYNSVTKDSHLSLQLENNNIIVFEVNTQNNDKNSNPCYYFYKDLEEYYEDFKYSFFNNKEYILHNELILNEQV